MEPYQFKGMLVIALMFDFLILGFLIFTICFPSGASNCLSYAAAAAAKSLQRNSNLFYITIISSKGASLVTQLVKNLPAMQETWVQFLGQEDPLEKEIATHSSILAWSKYLMDRGAWQAIVHGVARVGHDLVTKSPLY